MLYEATDLIAPRNWPYLFFALGLLVAAGGTLILRRRTDWSRAGRIAASALASPALLAALSFVGWLASRPRSDGWDDLVDAVWLTIALGGGGIAFVGGLVGASVTEWRRRA